MKDCEHVRDDLKAYLDGQLPPAPRLAARLHLARCASCRQEIAEMEQIGKELRAGDAATLDPALRARLIAGIPDEARPTNAPAWRRRPLVLWGAGATAVIAWFVFFPVFTPVRERARSVRSPQSTPSPGTAPGMYTQDYDEQYSHKVYYVGPGSVDNSRSTNVKTRMEDGRMVNSDANGQVGYADGHAKMPVGNDKEVGITVPTQVTAPLPIETDTAQSGPTVPVNGLVANRAPSVRQRMAKLTMKKDPSQEHDPAILLGDPSLPVERQVHREASITVAVTNVEQQSETVERIVKESRGYVANNELTTGEDNLQSASLILKVPVEQFDTILAQLTRLGELKSKSLTGEDITEKISDEEQASHVLRDDIHTTEAKLRQRRSRVQTAHDEETLRQLRIRIAQSQARLQMLQKLSALATITVDLQEKTKTPPPVEPRHTGGFMDEMSDTAHAAAHTFLVALRLPVQLLVWIVVYAPIWILLAIAYRRAVRA